MVKGPGVVTGRSGTLGKVHYIESDYWPHNTSLWVTRFNGNDPKFVYYLYESIRFERFASGSGVPTLNRNDAHGFHIAVPANVQEQRVIAAALSDTDALLGGLDRLIAKKRDLKQAAMRQLLTGQTRLPGFHGEWEVKRLGEIGTFFKGKGIKKNEVVAEGSPCVRYGELYTQHEDIVRRIYSFITNATAQESQLIEKGDLLFAGSGETSNEIGKCAAFLDECEAYAGGDIVVFKPVGQDSTFLGYLMNHPVVVRQKSRMGQGDAVVHIGAKNLAELEFRLPSHPEQSAIAAVLSDMDAELSALEARRDKTRALKQAMMQELLTGRTRLVMPEHEGATSC
jgi:type I restriction enzyme S subunit